MTAPDDDPLLGTRIAHFDVSGVLGRGGMGVVYRARDVLLEREVALKLLRPEHVADADRHRRFLREARSAARLSHPNIATVFEVGTFEGTIFLAMELVRGPTLLDVLAHGPLSIDRALRDALQIARGLAAAHRERLVHRDLKPSNVAIGPDGVVKLLDFGLARRVPDPALGSGERAAAISTRITSAGSVIGTPGYMSPEQALGLPLGLASDVFGFGVLVHEMLTGARPFADGVWRSAEPLELGALPSEVPAEIGAVLRGCLRYLPDQRYASAVEVLAALEPIASPRASGVIGELPTSIAPPLERARSVLPLRTETTRELVGRDAELEALEELIVEGTRLITITGPGGIGKTHVAIELARRASAQGTSAHLVPLAEARAATDLAATVRATLELASDPVSSAGSLDQIGHALRGRAVQVLVLDNFEQLLPAGGEVLARWMALATETCFVVTSRASLGLPEEARFSLGPLSTAMGVALLRARSTARRSSLVWDAGAEHCAREIVERLEGNPYAIELAAARADVLSLKQICDRLADRFRLLSDSATGKSLHETIAWSWELLAPAERDALARLSVLGADFDLAAAEALLALSRELWAPDVLRALQRQSLLRTVASPLEGEVRFVIEESVRLFAWATLDASAQAACEERALTHFAQRAGALSDALRTGAGAERWRELTAERSHVLRVAVHARTSGDGAALELALDALSALAEAAVGESRDDILANALADTYAAAEARGVPDRALARAAAALARAIADQDAAEAARRAQDSIARAGEPWVEASARSTYAMQLLYWRGDPVGAEEQATLAIERAKSAGAPGELAEAYRARASARWRRTRTELARADVERALAIVRRSGDRRHEPSLLVLAGLIRSELGDAAEARELFARVLELSEASGRRRLTSIALNNLACISLEQRDLTGARDAFLQASVIALEDGLLQFRAVMLGNLATVEHQLGNSLRALKLIDAALEGVDRESAYYALTLAARGAVLASLDRVDEARRDLAEAAAQIATKNDAIAQHCVEVNEGHLELALARRDPSAAPAWIDAARARLLRVRTPEPGETRSPYERAQLVRLWAAELEHAIARA